MDNQNKFEIKEGTRLEVLEGFEVDDFKTKSGMKLVSGEVVEVGEILEASSNTDFKKARLMSKNTGERVVVSYKNLVIYARQGKVRPAD